MSSTPSVTTAVPTGTWAADTAHSRVDFSVKHLGIATVRGTFRKFEGTIVIGDDISTAHISGSVDVDSVDTGEPKRDEHLRSADFFETETHPQLTFESTKITPVDEETFDVTGNFTLHGVTKEITLRAVVNGTEQDPWGNERVGFDVTGQINRGDYGITFNQALGSGNLAVSDKVKLSLDISAVKQA